MLANFTDTGKAETPPPPAESPSKGTPPIGIPDFLPTFGRHRNKPTAMKKAILSTYWVVAVLLIAWVVQSLGYTFPEALFMAAFFLPGTFFALYIPRKVATEDDRRRGRSLFYALMGTWLLELCLLLAAHGTVVAMRHAAGGHADFFDLPSLLAHPMFIAMVVVTFVAGNSLLLKWLRRKWPEEGSDISFTSERHKVTLKRTDILYVESNDTQTVVAAADGRRFRNKTPISQWADLLGDDFVRIHRSYVVRRSAVTEVLPDSVRLGQVELPVSRSYKKAVQRLMK